MTDQIFSPYLGNWLAANCSFNLLSALEGKDILLREASPDSMGFLLKRNTAKKTLSGANAFFFPFPQNMGEGSCGRKKQSSSLNCYSLCFIPTTSEGFILESSNYQMMHNSSLPNGVFQTFLRAFWQSLRKNA